MTENDSGSVPAMRELLDRLKDAAGPNWARDLVDEFTQAERKSISEALVADKDA